MAAVTLGHNLTRQEDFEGSPGGTIGNTGLGGGPGASAEAGLHYEAAQCLSRRIAGTGDERGFTYIHGDIGTVNMTTAATQVMLAKTFTALSAVIESPGNRVGIGDGVSDYYNYMVGDDGTMGDGPDFPLPPKGGYVITPIEVRVSAWHNLARVGTPDLTVTDMIRMSHQVSATTGAGTSQALDSIDYTGDGLFMWGGDGASADATFQDFVDADEGSGLTGAGRAGMWTSGPAGFIAYLNNVIGTTDGGTTTATVMTDSGFTVVFPGGFLSEGRNGLEFDLGNASTVITLSDGTVSGSESNFGGRSYYKAYFDTELDVTGGATDTINIPGHNFRQGDQVQYSAEGGTEDIGPDATSGEAEFATSAGVATNSDRWYVSVVDVDTVQLVATAASAYSATPTIVNLTASGAGNGENHSLTRTPDTRPDILFTSTTGSAVLTRVNLGLCKDITLTSVVDLNSCVISKCQSLTLADATLDTCIVSQPTTAIGEAFLLATAANDLDVIDGTSFTSGAEGHAIEITTTTGTSALQDVGFSGYFTGDTDNTGGVSFDPDELGNGGDVDLTNDDITITGHPFVDGDPVYYSDEGGTVITGLTDQALYYVNSIDANTISLHVSREGAETDTNRVNMTAGSTDATHKLYSANAAIYNSTGGVVSINVSGGDTPSIRNSAGSTTTVLNTVTLTVQVDDSDGNAVSGARVRIENASTGAQISQGSTNASGTYTDATYNYTGDLAVTTKVRLKGFKNFRTGGTILNTGLSVGVTFQTDNIVDLP